MAAMWTDLFYSLVARESSWLVWRGNGPGIGRDARIAYSSLLGRYMARAYLTDCEQLRVLVPLDVARRCFQESNPPGGYVIEKRRPPREESTSEKWSYRGREADWIGLDDFGGLVIVEAKGTFDNGKRTWCDPNGLPQALETAKNQVLRTVLRCAGEELPATRWAIASRWGTENNDREPTLLAWKSDEGKLCKEKNYRELSKILHSADVNGVVSGMGHSPAPAVARSIAEPGDHGALDSSALVRLRVGDNPFGEPGFAAIAGPFGVYPLRTSDRRRLAQIRDLRIHYAVALLSERYCKSFTTSQDLLPVDEPEHSASRCGLTVIWPKPDENVTIEEAYGRRGTGG